MTAEWMVGRTVRGWVGGRHLIWRVRVCSALFTLHLSFSMRLISEREMGGGTCIVGLWGWRRPSSSFVSCSQLLFVGERIRSCEFWQAVMIMEASSDLEADVWTDVSMASDQNPDIARSGQHKPIRNQYSMLWLVGEYRVKSRIPLAACLGWVISNHCYILLYLAVFLVK